MNVSIIISLIVGVISLIGFIYSIGFAWGNSKKDILNLKKDMILVREDVNKLDVSVHDLDNKVTTLSVQIAPFWNIIETKLANMLHSPHTPRYDELLTKLTGTLNHYELLELRKLLDDDLDVAKENNDLGRVLAITLVLSRVVAKIEVSNSIQKTISITR